MTVRVSRYHENFTEAFDKAYDSLPEKHLQLTKCHQRDFNDKMNRFASGGLNETISELVLREIKEARGE